VRVERRKDASRPEIDCFVPSSSAAKVASARREREVGAEGAG
jgi:hypothetical protein